MSDNRKDRLAADFHEMLYIQDRPYCSWIATKGELPYAEEYLLTIRVRTYALKTDEGRFIVGTIRQCTVKVSLWDSYPQVAPYIRMLSLPPVFHPDWYARGTYCSPVAWQPDASLKDYVKRMIATLQYAPELIGDVAPANYKALSWFEKHRDDEGLFPSDSFALTENTLEEAAAAKRAAIDFDEIVDSRGV